MAVRFPGGWRFKLGIFEQPQPGADDFRAVVIPPRVNQSLNHGLVMVSQFVRHAILVTYWHRLPQGVISV